jgi:hypothetical protein
VGEPPFMLAISAAPDAGWGQSIKGTIQLIAHEAARTKTHKDTAGQLSRRP